MMEKREQFVMDDTCPYSIDDVPPIDDELLKELDREAIAIIDKSERTVD